MIWQTRTGIIGGAVLRYSLVLIFGAFGLLKFTAQEAKDISGLVGHSPLLAWTQRLGIQGSSNLIGVLELAFALMVASRALFPRLSAWGSLGMAGALVTTLSFLATTPGMTPENPFFGFILKDSVLLGGALWTASEAFAAAGRRSSVA